MNHKLLNFKFLFLIVFFLAIVLSVPVTEDGYRAYKGTQAGDRWRLFMYYQTARYEGVPVALEKYGVKPDER